MNYRYYKWDPLSEALENSDELLRRYDQKKAEQKIISKENFKFYDDTGDAIAKVLNKPLKYEMRIRRYIILSKLIEGNFIIKLLRKFFG